MKKIETKKAPDAVGPYSQAIVSDGLVYVSGQLPVDPATGRIDAVTIGDQTKQAIENLGAVLGAAGSGLEKVIKTSCFIKNMDDFASFNEIYAEYFTGKPARSCVEVSALPKGALIEIDAIAKL